MKAALRKTLRVSRLCTLTFGVVLLGLSCKDDGEAHFRHARKEYESLATAGRPPTAPEFDAVLAELRAIPQSSRAYRHAQSLSHSLEAARVRPPQTPLATHSGARDADPGLSAQREACVLLAQQLGTATGEARAQLEQALRDCKAKVGDLKEAGEAKP